MDWKTGQKIIDKIRGKKVKPEPDPKYLVDNFGNIQGKYSLMGHGSFVCNPKTTIGSYCSIAMRVTIGAPSHPKHFLSTHSFSYHAETKLDCEYKLYDYEYEKPCKVGNDVWIGLNAVIRDGINIGDGAIIGANTVVTRDVEPYEIYIGGGGKPRRYRFSADIIKDLLELKWWELDENIIKDLPFDNINECIIKLKEIRKNG